MEVFFMIYYFTNFLIGTCLGSHVNLVFDRLSHDNFNILFGRSYCDYCLHPLSIIDEIPILSYVCLRGKCRFCKKAISKKMIITELIGGLSFFSFDFSDLTTILVVIWLFYLYVIALFDYSFQEFPTYLLSIPTLSASFFLWYSKPTLSSLDWINLIVILLVFIFGILRAKLGSGDLLIYLLLCCFYKPEAANTIILLACLLALMHFLLQKSSKISLAFIPYIFAGTVLYHLFFNLN